MIRRILLPGATLFAAATGDAAFAAWGNRRKDYVWRGGGLEVIFDLTPGGKLKTSSVTFDGESRKVD